jgi:hypothetical protein
MSRRQMNSPSTTGTVSATVGKGAGVKAGGTSGADGRMAALLLSRKLAGSNALTVRACPTPAGRRAELKAIAIRHPGAGTHAQRYRLLEALATGTVNTIEARTLLGVLHPASHVHELRRMGVLITTVEVPAVDSLGFTHQGVACYSLEAN